MLVRIIKTLFLLCFFSCSLASGAETSSIAGPSFLESYPSLKEHLYKEPSSDFYFGFAVAPVGIIRNRMFFEFCFFQSHYMSPTWDWEILSASFGMTTGQPQSTQSYHFTFRTAPKWRLTESFSLGPMVGFEYVSFPNVEAIMNKNSWATEKEAFSSRGSVYGIELSQTFNLKSDRPWRISELIYNQTYSTDKSIDDWNYVYSDNDLNKDKSPIKSGPVFLIELGIML